jgi:PCFT/HCP family folate transporter-like MFS transporter 1/3
MRVITVFTKKRSGHNRQRLFLITIVTILVLFILYGYTSVFTLYLYGHPFCLDALNVALITLAQSLTVSIVSLFIVLSKRTFDKTYILPLLGSIALIIGLSIFSFVKQIWLLYLAACIGSLFFISLPVLRTKLTKLVEINEYAVVFIAAGIIETVGHNAVGVIANDIYKSSVKFFPGLVFLIFAIVGVFPLIIMG